MEVLMYSSTSSIYMMPYYGFGTEYSLSHHFNDDN